MTKVEARREIRRLAETEWSMRQTTAGHGDQPAWTPRTCEQDAREEGRLGEADSIAEAIRVLGEDDADREYRERWFQQLAGYLSAITEIRGIPCARGQAA